MDRRLARTKRNIRAALLELTEKKSINDITITELSELADIDRKTFYLHYNTVRDVILEIEQEVASEVRELLSDKENLTISEIIHGLNGLLEKNFDFYKLIAEDSSISFLKRECKDILKQEIKTAYLVKSQIAEKEFMVYAEYCASGIIGVYTDWLSGNRELSLDELTEIASNAVENAWQRISYTRAINIPKTLMKR